MCGAAAVVTGDVDAPWLTKLSPKVGRRKTYEPAQMRIAVSKVAVAGKLRMGKRRSNSNHRATRRRRKVPASRG